MLTTAGVFCTRAEDGAATRHFTDRVKPLLDSRCISCHGPDKVKGRLRLDSREATLKGGESGPAMIPENPKRASWSKPCFTRKKNSRCREGKTLGERHRRARGDGSRKARRGRKTRREPTRGRTQPGKTDWRCVDDPRNPSSKIFGGQRLDLWSSQAGEALKPPKVLSNELAGSKVRSIVSSLRRLEDGWAEDRRRKLITAEHLARRLYLRSDGLAPQP